MKGEKNIHDASSIVYASSVFSLGTSPFSPSFWP
jgi:hypothetical protein